jgi:hypothetical protein
MSAIHRHVIPGYYPQTGIRIAASSRDVSKSYERGWTPMTSSDEAVTTAEFERILDPADRSRYDQELGVNEATLARAIQEEQNQWTAILKYGVACIAGLLLFASENVVRFYGVLFAPDFEERVAVQLGEFVDADHWGREQEVSDHRYCSVFSSSSERWQYVLSRPMFPLQVPTVAALALFALWGSRWALRIPAVDDSNRSGPV